MSYFPYKLTKELRQQLEKFGLKKNEAEQLIKVELLLLGINNLDPSVPLEEMWSLLIGYDEPVIRKYTDKKLLMRLRLFFPEFRHGGFWLESLASYFQLDGKYRLFIEEEGKVRQISPQLAINRSKVYSQCFSEPIEKQARKKEFGQSGEFSYQRFIDTIPHTYTGTIPETGKVYPELKKHTNRKKVNCSFSLQDGWDELANEMESKSKGFDYVKRAERIEFQSLHPSTKSTFIYEETQHIAGGLSAGKSTWMVMETYHQVTKNGAKVGFIENSVSQVRERVRELRALGIHAVPIIGKGGRQKHTEQFLASHADSSRDISQFLEEEFQGLQWLSDSCTLKALANDFTRDNYYPCQSIIQNDQKVLCPLAHTCGIYQEWTNLAQADVWIATTASLIESKLPAVVDPLERTVFQAMYDWLDIVFVDEADAVQKQLDERFIVEVEAFGNMQSFLEQLLLKERQTTIGKYSEFANDKLVQKWRLNLGELDKTVWQLFAKVQHTPMLRKSLDQELLFPNRFAYKIAKKLAADETTREKIEKRLRKFAGNPSGDKQLTHHLQQMLSSELRNDASIRAVLLLLVEDADKVSSETKDMLEFFLYFAYMDYNFKFLLSYYPAVQSRLGTGYDSLQLLTRAKEYRPFLLEAMTGPLLGYRYEQAEDGGLGVFKLIEYSGIGRRLLYDWHSIYESAFGRKGPSVVLLSGTSLAPGSDHYNVEMQPQWLIRSQLPQSEIMQSYIPMFDRETHQKICISGQGEQKRQENLRKITRYLENRLLSELNMLKKEGRRILLVVNSYVDAQAVADTLEGMSSMRENYRVLKREGSGMRKEFSRSQIELFRRETEQILIVPLMSVGRGFNILDENGGALFGSVFFLVRPYPVPNDFSYMIQTLHAALPSILERIERKNLRYAKAIKELRRQSMIQFEMMYKKADFWASLRAKEREALSWFIFIPVWQMIGRLLRGGRNARIFYCDGSFHQPAANVPSLLEYWKKKMKKHRKDEIFMAMYGPFVKSIDTILEEEREDEN
ncbi:hypothetical protein MUG87_19200 [Ectobacillus sp. JY-23]|uniref:pPIWI_RE_Z domain-containing protein n=1 Tax=Ectobacillus sp. JY-23 TaxID=2933872 RepID=UPI001FF6A415|nr:hypothetical protein [Ectobacillus sp. JY-23]UOY92511.1 hypothetical protein MUG87_19200 [Ectobacillus sp. JY-23]